MAKESMELEQAQAWMLVASDDYKEIMSGKNKHLLIYPNELEAAAAAAENNGNKQMMKDRGWYYVVVPVTYFWPKHPQPPKK